MSWKTGLLTLKQGNHAVPFATAYPCETVLATIVDSDVQSPIPEYFWPLQGSAFQP